MPSLEAIVHRWVNGYGANVWHRRSLLAWPFAESVLFVATPARSSRPSASIADFGADLLKHGADHTLALERAMASRQTVFLPPLPNGQPYRLSRPLEDRWGAQIVGGSAIIEVSHPDTFLTLSSEGARFAGLTFRPVQDNRQYGLVLLPTAHRCEMLNITIAGGNSGIRVEGTQNAFEQIKFLEMKGTSLRLEGQSAMFNQISDISIRNGALAGILFEQGAHHNTVVRARKWVDRDHIPSSFLSERGMSTNRLGGDICAFAASAHHNRASQVSCSDARDGCFTISGDDNELDGGLFQNGLASGCSISGSRNRVSSVNVTGCKTGFRVIPQAGGLAKDNIFRDCGATSSLEYGFRFDANAYREWQAGVTRDPPTHFCFYANNVYRTPHAVRTFGNRPPTHRDGTVSDGTTPWTFVAHDPKTLDADRNQAVRCSAQGSGMRDWFVRGSGSVRLERCPGQADGLLAHT